MGAEDKRIQKTKAKLKSTLLALLKEKDIQSVSVTELCKMTNLNRNTFYAHYRSPSEVLEEIEEEFLYILGETVSTSNFRTMSLYSMMSAILTLIYERKDICSVIFSAHGNKNFIKNVTYLLKAGIISDWISKGMTELESNVMYSYCVSGAIGVLEDWVRDDFKTPIPELTQILCRLILQGQATLSNSTT